MEKIKKEFSEVSYTLEEMAKFLGYEDKEIIRRKVKCGEIIGFKCGKRWMVRESNFLAFVEKLENNAKNQAILKASHKRSQEISKNKNDRSSAIESKNLREKLRANKN